MRINTILPDYLSKYGGPTFVCHYLLEAMRIAGLDVSLFCITGEKSIHKPYHRLSMPHWAQPVGYRLFSDDAWARYTEWRYLRSLQDQDIAYLWTKTSTDTYKKVRSAGHIILTENVNTHQATSKAILDSEYRRLGLIPSHGIDEASIAKECEQLELVDYVFSPSGEVTKSLINASVPNEKIIQTSYGLRQENILSSQAIASRAQRTELTALFVGRIGIRKGAHLLLEYWAKSGVKGKLKLVGNIEPSARHLVEPYLSRPDIEHVSFAKDLSSVYLNADVFLFPSLEEGSPLVTYLALGAGLPSIVSPMGGDGIINHGIEGLVVDAHNTDGWVDSIRKVFSDAEFRLKLSSNAYNRAEDYLWKNVGRRRADSLRAVLAARAD
jgi:glycosyltransferase involved in cell wall biosynthesis